MTSNDLVDLALGAGAWFETYLVHSTLLLVGAWLVARTLGRSRPLFADALWKTAICAGLVTATLQTAAPWRPAAGAVLLAGPIPAGSRAVTENQTLLIRPGQHPVARREQRTHQVGAAEAAAAAVPPLLGALWVVVAGVLAMRFVRARRALGRALRLQQPAADRALTEPWAALLASEPGVAGAVLTCAPGLAGPVALAGGVVCVPEDLARRLDPGEVRATLAHEMAHLKRGDPDWLRVFAAVRVVGFLQPLHALAFARFRDGAELLCDAWAVRVTQEPALLARAIVALARAPASATPGAALGGRRGASLVARLRLLLEGGAEVRAGHHRAGFAVGIALAAGVLLAAPVVVPPERDASGGFRVTDVRVARGRDRAGPAAAGTADSIAAGRR